MAYPGIQAQAYFDDIASQLVEEVLKARFSIRLAVAWLTHPDLVDALCKAADRAVVVEIIISRSDTNFSRRANILQLFQLLEAGATVLVNGPERSLDVGFLHHKFCIVDFETVITGSFNWTRNAASNEENILVTRADQRLARQYQDTFHELLHSSLFLSQVLPEQSYTANSADPSPAELYLWASVSVAAPGTAISLHWKSAGAIDLQLDGLAASTTPLPSTGELAFDFPQIEQRISLLAFTAEGEGLTSSVLLRPARLPVIERFELSHPVTVGGLIPVQLSWKTSQAEQIIIHPSVGLDELPLEGSVTVSPSVSTTYTLTALGIGGRREQAVSLFVASMPQLKRLDVPVPIGIRLQAELRYTTTSVPSGLDLTSAKVPALRLPALTELRSEMMPTTPTLSNLAASLGVASPGDLRLPPRPASSSSYWQRTRARIFNSLEQHFAHDWRLTHLLSTFRTLYGK
ncbi:phospholipase D-like domain-containing protein [Hymenobacter sp. BT635]|uniref:phospholipase D n=1 Tax=Hymenobacter nitidus TaxID=2880929 RepID=A0ABS8AJI4_9BACT|nr:phospholipase D-like domain-containing protein [Hymenobacter nitidus]